MRRLAAGFIAVLLPTLGAMTGAAPSLAEEAPDATLTLVSQSAWNAPNRPLAMAVRATNRTDQPLRELSVVLSIQAPARSRSEYELSLQTDATSLLSATLFPQNGPLQPGQSRTFRLREPLESLASRQENAIYPLKIQLLSGDRAVGELRTPMVFLIERPRFPLNLAWTWVLSAPLQYRPDGTFLPGSLESEVARAGRLSVFARALSRLRRVPVDVAVSPVLADQLVKMAAGYRVADASGATRTVRKGTAGAADAARVLTALRRTARREGTELIALPFGDAVLPSMIRAGLGTQVPAAIAEGRAMVGSALDAAPKKDVLRPTFSSVDDATLAQIESLGVKTVLLDPAAVRTAPAVKFSPIPLVKIGADPSPMQAIVPDPQVMTTAAGYPADPPLAAHAALGELAATWLEFPGLPHRAAAVLFPERFPLDARFGSAFARLVRSSPWLKPMRGSRLPSLARDSTTGTLTPTTHPRVSPTYVGRLNEVRTSLDQFQSTAEDAGPLIGRLRDRLLLAGTAASAGDATVGQQFVDSVDAAIRTTYAGLDVTEGVVTLTSRQGFIPVTLRNSSSFPLRIRVRLIADLSVAFVNGSSRRVTIPPSEQTLTFAVRAKTTGRFPVRVQVRTSGPESSAETITQSELVVRSTAYNRLALFLTIGAGLFLLWWWGRRFLHRARS